MRKLFLLEPGLVFLNHGSYGACPREVLEALQAWQWQMERNPVQFLGRRSAELLAHARAQLAAELGARGDDLVFVANATTAVNAAAHSLAALLKPGNEVLGTDHEYGACVATWQRACAAAGAHYRVAQVPLPYVEADFVGHLMAAATPRTKVLFASHIASTTALRFPVGPLCSAARQRGITTVIDGAHAPGQMALNLAEVGADFYTGNCHKWMCAPKGAAFLHVQPAWQDRLHANVVSWGYVAGDGGHTGFDAYTGRSPLERRLQWQGTRDLAPFLTVPTALQFQARHGWPAWREQCHQLACQALHRVLARNGLQAIAADSAYGQMVPIPVRTSDAEGLRQALFDQYCIEVPVTQHGGQTFVRASLQAYNTQADVDALVNALQQLAV